MHPAGAVFLMPRFPQVQHTAVTHKPVTAVNIRVRLLSDDF